MINTQLHNKLMEKDMQKKLVQTDILIQKEKKALLYEKSKSYLVIIALVFLVLFLFIFLFWIFSNKNLRSNEVLPQAINVECHCDCDKNFKKQKVDPIQDTNTTKKHKVKNSNKKLSGDTYKNGNEYVKEGNHIHKKSWNNGNLIKDITLEETIQESRDKYKEDIPQISTPETGKKR